MKLIVAAVGARMPDWITQGWNDYAKRMPADCALELREIKPESRTKGKTPGQMMAAEAQRLRAAVPLDAITIALDERGHAPATMEVSQQLEQWRSSGRDVVFFIGGPDGLDPTLKQNSQLRWRLSSMTLPHPLVRVVLAEQLYRAWAIMTNHPYHRA